MKKMGGSITDTGEIPFHDNHGNGQAENGRLDMYHHIIHTLILDQAYHLAPLTPSGTELPVLRVLDIGCGTGIWAMAMADKYPEGEIIGTDLSLIQPQWIPRNLRFRRLDFEGPWFQGQDSWDLIHLSMLSGSVSSWQELYGNAWQHLKPGVGYVEQIEIDIEPRCDDESIPKQNTYKNWYNYMLDATRRANRPIEYRHDTPRLLQRAGFVDIEHREIRLPIGEWGLDTNGYEIGRWYRTALNETIETLSLAPFCRSFGWPIEDVKRYAGEVVDIVKRADYHLYNVL
ncbi:hypothetical protein MMC21_000872 [Puttea exsequens]|nr:hypothetical protein [Puttea exsequens]